MNFKTLVQLQKGRLKYEQIYEALKKAILDNQLEHLTMLPLEEQLALELSVSKTSVRQAYRLLVEDKLIQVIPRKGHQVIRRHRTLPYSSKIRSIRDDLKELQVKTSIKVLHKERISNRVIGLTYFEPDEELVFLRRVFLADEEAFIIEESYYPSSILPNFYDLDFNSNDVFTLMKLQYDLNIHRLTRRFKPIFMPKAYAELLNVQVDSSCFLVISSEYDQYQRCVGYNYIHAIGNMFTISPKYKQ